MKKILSLLLLLLIMKYACSQQSQESRPSVKKFTTGIELFTDIWQGPYKNMVPSNFNRGVEIFAMYNVPMEKTPLTFSLGVGIGVHNLYSDAALVLDENNNYSFQPISSYLGPGTAVQYKKNKITVTYGDFPFEFRYKSKTDFKAAIGMKFGFVLGSHTKYKGEDYMYHSSETVKIKTMGLKNLERWRYGLTAKIGYRAVELYGFYSFTNLFRKDEGPEMYPISLGLSLRPF